MERRADDELHRAEHEIDLAPVEKAQHPNDQRPEDRLREAGYQRDLGDAKPGTHAGDLRHRDEGRLIQDEGGDQQGRERREHKGYRPDRHADGDQRQAGKQRPDSHRHARADPV